MEYRKFGKTGWQVSEIGYGMWGLAGWTGSDSSEVERALHQAVERGCNFFDTAWAYGDGRSEQILGKLIKDYPDHKLYAATKIPPKNRKWPSKPTYALDEVFPASYIIEYTEKSLKNLGVECIDLLQFHVWDDSWASKDEWKSAIRKLTDEGKVNHWGISVNRWEPNNSLQSLKTNLFSSVQVIYNIFDQNPEDELFPLCRKLDIGVIARVPFDEGTLTGTLTYDTVFPKEDWRSTYFVPENLKTSVDRANALKPLIPQGMTMAEMSLRFILANPDVGTIIPGMRKTRNVEANIASSDGNGVSAELLKELKNIVGKEHQLNGRNKRMTKEINDILNAFKAAQLEGRKTALATVVHVEGSSYRRPGARMLVEDNGKITGAISGGCLEGDALKKALLAIEQQHNKLVTYNTLHEDDVDFGVQLGCNGVVHILFEPIDSTQVNNPITLLEKCCRERKDAVLVTLFSLKNFLSHQYGTCLMYDGENLLSQMEDKSFESELKAESSLALSKKTSLLIQYDERDLTAFVELVVPPISLVITGAGNDSLPLVDIATVLGWQITILDGRPTHANRKRFPYVHQVITGKPAELLKQLSIDERTAVVLMTHNYNYDLAMMEILLTERCSYIGVLGPKKKLDRMLTELEEKDFVITNAQRAHIYGPTGLDIGAETAEEIGLSIVSEIKAVFANREGNSLRERTDVIHSRNTVLLNETDSTIRF